MGAVAVRPDGQGPELPLPRRDSLPLVEPALGVSFGFLLSFLATLRTNARTRDHGLVPVEGAGLGGGCGRSLTVDPSGVRLSSCRCSPSCIIHGQVQSARHDPGGRLFVWGGYRASRTPERLSSACSARSTADLSCASRRAEVSGLAISQSRISTSRRCSWVSACRQKNMSRLARRSSRINSDWREATRFHMGRISKSSSLTCSPKAQFLR